MTTGADAGVSPDIVRRATRDGLWNAIALGVPGVASILIVAYLFRSVGPDGYAPWATALGVIGLLTILDAGLSTTTARSAARALAGDPEALLLVRAAYAAYAGLALAVLLLGVLAAPLIPTILRISGEGARAAIVVGIVLSADFAVVMGTAGWVGTLRGARRFDLICVANVIQVAVIVPATILLVPPLGLPGAAMAQLSGRLAGRLTAAVLLRRAVPLIPMRPGRVARSDARTLGLFALPILAAGISTQLGVGADPIIVALAAGPTAVGLYAAGSSLVRYAAFLLFPVLSVLLPGFAELGYSRPGEVAPTVLRCLRIAAAIGVVAFGSLAVSGTPILETWIGRADRLSLGVLVLYALAHLAWVPSQVLIIALIATGRHGPVGLALLADSVVNVVLSVVLVLTIGPIGVAISTLVLLAIVHIGVIPAIAARRLGIPPLTLARSLGIGAGTGIVVVAVVGLLPDSGALWLVVRGATAIAAIAAILAVDQRASAHRRLVAMRP